MSGWLSDESIDFSVLSTLQILFLSICLINLFPWLPCYQCVAFMLYCKNQWSGSMMTLKMVFFHYKRHALTQKSHLHLTVFFWDKKKRGMKTKKKYIITHKIKFTLWVFLVFSSHSITVFHHLSHTTHTTDSSTPDTLHVTGQDWTLTCSFSLLIKIVTIKVNYWQFCFNLLYFFLFKMFF